MGIFDRIAGSLDNLAGQRPDSAAAAREEIELAMGFADRGDRAEAEARLRSITERFPRLPLGFARLGELLSRRDADDEAAAAYGRAVDLDPDDFESWFGLGERLARLRRFEPARDAFRRALTLSVDPLQRGRAHAALGRLHAAAGGLGKAARELGKAAALLPSDTSVAADYGDVLARAGDPEAAAWLTRAARAPGAGARLAVQAAAAAEANEAAARARSGPAARPEAAAEAKVVGSEAAPPTAEQLLREAIERAPAEVIVRAALSGYLTRAGRADEGLALALEAVAAEPGSPDAQGALREAYAAAGRFAEALGAARREAELAGAPPPFDGVLPLALGARDRAALAALAGAPREGEPPAARPLRAFLARTADEADLIALAALAPDEASRRFVVEGLAPGKTPEGNLVALLGHAHQLAARTPELWAQAIPTARAAEAFDRPLLVAVMGEFNAGKSSFVNALCGEEIAPVGVTPTTATINILRHGPRSGRVIHHDGTVRELGATEVAPFLKSLDGEAAAAVRLVEIFHPLEVLRRVEIVDTPGLNSLRPEHESVARDFLVEADAIVWLFAVGQAAKASEKQVLGLARSAGKRVLGVLSKIDRASDAEVAEVTRHVSATVGDLVEAVVPISARLALEARRRGGAAAPTAGGFDALEKALEARFFRHARALKRTTALGALRRFVAEARRAAAASTSSASGAERDFVAELKALGAGEERLRGAVAAERIALRARIAEAYRSAAFEVREFVRPRSWLFGAHKVDAADEEFLVDLLGDAIVRANAQSRGALGAALAPPDDPLPLPAAVATACERTCERAFDRFSAYARGVVEGGAVPEFFRQDLPRIRLDLGAIRSALARRVPDPEDVLFRALDCELGNLFRDARRALVTAQAAARVRALIRHDRLVGPLDDLERAVENLALRGDEPPPAAAHQNNQDDPP